MSLNQEFLNQPNFIKTTSKFRNDLHSLQFFLVSISGSCEKKNLFSLSLDFKVGHKTRYSKRPRLEPLQRQKFTAERFDPFSQTFIGTGNLVTLLKQNNDPLNILQKMPFSMSLSPLECTQCFSSSWISLVLVLKRCILIVILQIIGEAHGV